MKLQQPVPTGKRDCISSNNNNICVGTSLKGEDILFFQKKISYQHNMIAQVFVYHIKLLYFKIPVG